MDNKVQDIASHVKRLSSQASGLNLPVLQWPEERSAPTMVPEKTQKQPSKALKDSEIIPAKAMGLLQDLVEEVKVLKEAQQKIQQLPALKPQEILQRIEEMEALMRDRNEFLELVGQKLSIIPGGEEVTMVTWEELEQAIADGWRTAQGVNGSETLLELAKRRRLSSITTSDVIPSGASPRQLSTEQAFDPARGFGPAKTGSVSSGTGHPSERVTSREQVWGLPATGVLGSEQHPRTSEDASTPRSQQSPGAQIPVEAGHRRGMEQLFPTRSRRAERGSQLGPLPQDLPPVHYPQYSAVPFSHGQVYLRPDQHGPATPSVDQPGLVQPRVHPRGMVPYLGQLPPDLDDLAWIASAMDQRDVMPPSTADRDQQALEVPSTEQHNMYEPVLALPGTDQWRMVQPGMDESGMAPLGTDQPGLVWAGLQQHGFVSPLPYQYGLVSPGLMQSSADQQNLVRPNLEISGVIQPGRDQRGLGQPGVDQRGLAQPGVDQRGLAQPGVDQRGLVQPGVDRRGLGQPGVDRRGLGQPGVDQRGLVQPGVDRRGLGQPGVDQRGLVQPGVDRRGLGQPGVDQRGLVQPGVDRRGLAQPGVDQRGLGQPGVDQRGLAQSAVGQPGMAQPGVDQRGLAQPGVEQPDLAQPGVDQRALAQPGVDRHGLAQPGAYSPGLAQHGMYLRGLAQPGMYPQGLVQSGMYPRGLVPGMYPYDLAKAGVDQPGLAQPGLVHLGVEQPGLAQPGLAQPGVDQPGLAQPGEDQPGLAQSAVGQPGLVQPGVDQPGLAQSTVGQPGLVQPGMYPHGLAQPGMYSHVLAQPGMYPRGLVQPGMYPHVLVQPGDQHDLAQPGVDQHGLAQPRVDQPDLAQSAVGQPGMAQPGMDQRGLAQPGVDQPDLAQSAVDQRDLAQSGMYPHGLWPPGMYPRGLVSPGMYPPGLVPSSMYPQGLLQPGVDQRGLVQPGADASNLLPAGAAQLGFVHPGADESGLVQSGTGEKSLVQAGTDTSGLVQPGADEQGLVPPGLDHRHLVQAGTDEQALVAPGTGHLGMVQPRMDRQGRVWPSAYPPGLTQPGSDQHVLMQHGTYPHGLAQSSWRLPGADEQGVRAPHTGSQGLPELQSNFQIVPPPHHQYRMPPRGRELHGHMPSLVGSQGLASPSMYQRVPPGTYGQGLVHPSTDQHGLTPGSTGLGSAHPEQERLAPSGPDEQHQPAPATPPAATYAPPDHEGPRHSAHRDPGHLGVDQRRRDLSRIHVTGQSRVMLHAAPPGQDSHSHLHTTSSERSDIHRERHDSLDRVEPSFPMAVETFRLVGELIGLYVEFKESMKDLDKEQTGKSDLEKIQYLLSLMVKKTMPPDLQDQLKNLKILAKEFRQEKAKLEKLQKMVEAEGELEAGKELKGGQLGLQLGILRVTVADIEKELAELRESQVQGKATMENSVSEASFYLQEQLDKLRAIIESMLTSSSTLLSMSMPSIKAPVAMAPGQINPEATCPACSLDLSHQVSLLVQRYEQLQDMVSNLAASRPSKKAKLQSQDEELLGHVQSAILQVQGDCEKLNITTSHLIEDHRQKQKDIDVLYQGLEKLEKEKANRGHLEMEIDVKADKSALAAKVSRVQFDATTEQLNHMMQELVAKMSGQEQDWQKMLDRLLMEMDSKLDRLELDPLKQLLEDRWKSLRQQLKERSPLYQADDAAAMRRQLLAHFHCLSCDRPLETPVTGQLIPVTPVGPSLPGHRSIRPYTVFELEQVRQQGRNLKLGSAFARGDLSQMERSVRRLRTMHSKMLLDIEKVQIHFGGSTKASSQMIRELLQAQCLSSPCYKRMPDLADYTYSTVPRRCGGSHTLTYPYRRTRLQHLSQGLYPVEEVQITMKHDEVDILGLDGHIYKGRMDTRLPGILTKDGLSSRHKPKLSRPQVHQQQSPSDSSQPPSRPQSAHTLVDSNPVSLRQQKDRPVSSEGRLSEPNAILPLSSADMATLQALDRHLDVPPGEGLEEPTRGPRSTPAHRAEL
ncbi:glutamine-rich protein 2 isoform X2 [Ochotona princeps]|nr:glutamine-rich protein 2 isoform X2 [Ochotona princeps]